jgi:hypothetical protein
MSTMSRLNPVHRLSMLLLCSVLLVMRIGGAHWHLCFDGREPPVSIHIADSSFEHSSIGIDSQHHDQNVDIGLASLTKHGSADFDLPPLLLAAFLFWAAIPRRAVPRARKAPVPTWSDLSLLLPPLRGPPAIAIS